MTKRLFILFLLCAPLRGEEAREHPTTLPPELEVCIQELSASVRSLRLLNDETDFARDAHRLRDQAMRDYYYFPTDKSRRRELIREADFLEARASQQKTNLYYARKRFDRAVGDFTKALEKTDLLLPLQFRLRRNEVTILVKYDHATDSFHVSCK